MKKQFLAVAGIGSVAVACTASASLTGAVAENLGDIGGGANTYRIYLTFDNPADTLLAVNGDSDVSSLLFQSLDGNSLVNSSLFGGTTQEDVHNPEPISDAWDSWVTIGPVDSDDTAFSPGFGGGPPGVAVIQGTSWGQVDNGGYFDQNPGTPVTPDGGQILIAQFTIAGAFSYEGTGSYQAGGAGDPISEAFFVMVPAPGALALLGLAGLAGRRRRG